MPVETVTSFKYLGTHIDDKLNFTNNTDFIYKKAQQRLFLLRKLKSFNVSEKVLESVSRSLKESILTFNLVMPRWYGNVVYAGDVTRPTAGIQDGEAPSYSVIQS